MRKASNHVKGKILIIGLDSATLDLIRPWAEAGQLPHLARLIQEGVSGALRSTIPTISPAAWTSFMTGRNPGKHGVYDFIQRRPNSYHLQYVQPDLRRLGTIFGRLSQLGRRVAVIGVPMTYPPEPVNGLMIAGPWAPENETCVYPSDVFPLLQQRGYEINNSQAYSPETAEAFAAYLEKTTDTRASVALDLLRRESWDLFMLVFRDVDTVMSFYWHDMDRTHPLHSPERGARLGNVILDHHRQLDRYIGNMIAEIDSGTSVLVLSDHGGGPLYAEISINRWLLDQGLLALKQAHGFGDWYRTTFRRLGITRSGIISHLGWPLVNRFKRLLPGWAEQLVPWPHAGLIDQVDWSRTKAYSYGSIGQIHINLKGREPHGIVEPGAEYEELVNHIVDQLEHLVDERTGRKVKVQVCRREEIYHGPFAELGPDLNIIFDDMSCVTHITLDAVRDQMFGPPADHETGFHRLNGMFILWGPHILQGVVSPAADIIDIAPTLLYMLGEAVPQDMDGRVLTEVFNPDRLTVLPIQRDAIEDSASLHQPEVPGWSQEDEAKLLQHLRDLGYLG